MLLPLPPLISSSDPLSPSFPLRAYKLFLFSPPSLPAKLYPLSPTALDYVLDAIKYNLSSFQKAVPSHPPKTCKREKDLWGFFCTLRGNDFDHRVQESMHNNTYSLPILYLISLPITHLLSCSMDQVCQCTSVQSAETLASEPLVD